MYNFNLIKCSGKYGKWITGLTERNIVLISMIITFICMIQRVHAMDNYVNNSISQSLVRIHIIANSDSTYDQEEKLRLKEIVFPKVEAMISRCTTIEEMYNFIVENKKVIEKIVRDNAREIGIDSDIVVEFSDSTYPLKMYEGNIVEQGKYYSLKIVIGEGKGHNFWQALYAKETIARAAYRYDNINDSNQEKKVAFKLLDILKRD